MKISILNFSLWNCRIKNMVIIACLAIFSAPSVQAALPDIVKDPVVAAIEELQIQITSRLDATVTEFNKLFKNAYDVLTSRSKAPNVAIQDPEKVYQLEGVDNEKQGVSKQNVYDLVGEYVTTEEAKKLQNFLTPENISLRRKVLLKPFSDDKNAVAEMLNAQALLGPLVYSTPDQQNLAQRALEFLSDYASPLGGVDLQTLAKEKPDSMNTPAVEEYKVKIFAQAALRSLYGANFYQNLASRMPVKGLGTEVGMSKTDASLAEVQRYMASRRISNKNDWYAEINNASSVVVQREIAFILSELQWQLYQLHTDNERILQTLTASGILNLRTAQAMPDENEMKLKTELQGVIPAAPNPNDNSKKFNIESSKSQ